MKSRLDSCLSGIFPMRLSCTSGQSAPVCCYHHWNIMRFILFLILTAGATVGLYYAGLAYEEQSDEFTSFQRDCAPKQVTREKLKTEISDIQNRLLDIDKQYVEKIGKVADQLKKSSALNPSESFALTLLQEKDIAGQTLTIKQRIESIDAHLNLVREQTNKTIQKNEDAIINNTTRLDNTIITERNKLGSYYSSHPDLGKELAARNVLEAKLNQLKKTVDKKNEQILQANLNLKKKFEAVEQNALDEKSTLDQLLTQISESSLNEQGLISSNYYRKLLAKNPSFGALNKNYTQAIQDLTNKRNKKHDELQAIVTQIESHPYTILQKNSIHGIRSLVIMILIGIDAILITFFYFVLLRRNYA